MAPGMCEFSQPTCLGLPHGLIAPVAIAAMISLCFGYDAGVMSGAITAMSKDFDLQKGQQGIVLGCVNIVAAPGALLISRLADWGGRRLGISSAALVLFVGPIFVSLSTDYAWCLMGRLVVGLGVGAAFVMSPVYAAEIAPPSVRGFVVSVTEVMLNVGVLLGYISAMIVHWPGMDPSLGWRITMVVKATPAVITLMYSPWLPESPRWLVQARRHKEAEAVLRRVCANQRDVEESMESISEAITEDTVSASWWDTLWPRTASLRRMHLAVIGCAFFQQLTGPETLVYYTHEILGVNGFSSYHQQNVCAIIIGALKVTGAIIGAFVMDVLGRRLTLIISLSGIAVSQLAFALTGFCPVPQVCVFFFGLMMVFFEIGVAPALYVLATECYPIEYRAKGLALGVFITQLSLGLVTAGFPVATEKVGYPLVFLAFFTVAAVGVGWAVTCVPETLGVPLEKVSEVFGDTLPKLDQKRKPFDNLAKHHETISAYDVPPKKKQDVDEIRAIAKEKDS